ncbi:hypothetical protein W03_24350 [Nitrosomonas sp. PY1]|uniref:Rap1a/Tai family immunity protein n=1 Tax=Nitrosomonas sp. PY1 TaxID=1803906 RepID=UPI001FC86E87|nr:Rap1a/Tai family immunity protein [Nitrosomonas sp. PY1]GKS70431.1 hypothetical protein W03_24350 [Nitrosomonas sp. PY1]
MKKNNLCRIPVNLLMIVMMGIGCLVASVQAATENNFMVKNTQDIVELCSVSQEDKLYTQAIHFCHGYLVGIYHYQNELYKSPGLSPIVCIPKLYHPASVNSEAERIELSRNHIITGYIQWVKEHPDYLKESIVNSLMKYLVNNYSCKDD